MANSVPFRTTPQLGPQLDDVFNGLPYWDLTGVQGATDLVAPLSGITEPSYKLGNVETGDDGAQYMWVKANGVIASNAAGIQLAIALPGYLATTGGTSGWWTQPNTALVAGQYFHARLGSKTANGGVPA